MKNNNVFALLLVLFTGSIQAQSSIQAQGSIQAQIINFSDPNFKAALLAHVPNIDTSEDGEIDETEAAQVTHLKVSNKKISSLEGIQFFINLIDLDCSRNLLTTLNIDDNTALTRLNCFFNKITTLSVVNNPKLTYLNLQR